MIHKDLRKARLAVAIAALVATPLAACGSESESESDGASGECSDEVREAEAEIPDFNGDGHADLAIPAPLSTVDGVERAGAVSVVYGSRSGPDTGRPQVISRATEGALGELAARGSEFGTSPVARDLDGDGFSDLAVTVSGDDASMPSRTAVLWGSAEGLAAGTMMPGGSGLRGGDFDGDGQADLLMGNLWGAGGLDGGGLTALYGPLTRDGEARRTDSFGGTSFGDSPTPQDVIVGDLTGDGRDDLVTSQAFEEMQWRGRFFPSDECGLRGWEEGRDVNAYSLNGVVADVDGDGIGDLVVRDVGEVSEAYETQEGELRVLRGSESGPVDRAETISQETVGLDGASGDEFGAALAAADVNGDGHVDLAVGIPGERTGQVSDAGALAVLLGGEDGLTGGDPQVFDQDAPGVPDAGEPLDRFGTALWLGDVDGDGHPELAAGAPGERDGDRQAGAVWVFGGAADGPVAANATTFGPAALGAPARGVEGLDIFWTGTYFGQSFAH
ncbi:hypothetical protein [Streptomyces sp. 6N223]|uniref:hypothetical protein n=1 Tax=Streptomyces sp. 6N223 TaxID=3457412 RepID=UPI003FD2429D